MNRSPLDTLLADLRQRRDACRTRIAEHQDGIAAEQAKDSRLAQLEAYAQEELNAERELTPSVQTRTRVDEREVNSTANKYTTGSTRLDAVEAIMAKAKTAMRINDIIEHLVNKGAKLEGYDRGKLYNSLYVTMKKSKSRFRNANGLWTLVGTSRDVKSTNHGGGVSANGTAKVAQSPTYVDAAEFFGKQRGAPFRLGELADWMIERGFKQEDKRSNIVGTLHGALKNSPKFRNSNGLWELVSDSEQVAVDHKGNKGLFE